jgi:tetratricopeptide (TPR) repeat protein
VDLNRVVELHFGGRPLGSGYLITSRHVLTARHVADPPAVGTSCTVFPLTVIDSQPSASSSTDTLRGEVGWIANNVSHDLAIIETRSPDGFPLLAGLRAVEFGRLPFDATAWSCSATGFPEASDRDDRTIDVKLRRVVRSAQYDVDVESRPPRDWRKWAGFSGAVLFCGDLAVAVIRTVDANWDGKLGATPVQFLVEDETFLRYWTQQGQLLPSIRTLDRAQGTPAAPAPLVGSDLPQGALRFTGRQEELERLDIILGGGASAPGAQPAGRASARARYAAVHGRGGVGKTSLAVEYVSRYRDGYWGVWWCAAATRLGVLTGLAALGKALDLPPAGEGNIENAAKNALRCLSQSSGTFLLVYDNAPEPSKLDGLLPDGGASVLITSRFSDWGEWAEEVPLLVLREAEGAALLEHRAGRQDPTGAAILAEALGYLPLALEHAAAYCKRTQTSFADYASKTEALIAKVPRGESYPRSIAATFELAMAEAIKQSTAARPLLCYVALCSPDRIPMALVEGAVGNEDRAEALAALTETSLVKHDPFEDGTPAVTVHRLVQMVARASTPYDDALAAHRNLALTLCGIYPSDGDSNPKSWPICARLTPHLLSSRLYVEQHLEELWGPIFGESLWPLPSVQLDDRAGNYFQGRGAYSLAEPLYRAALNSVEKMLGPEHPETATALGKLAGVLEGQANFAGARPLFERALAIRESGPGAGQQATAVSLNNLARLLWMQGDFAGARPLFERALTIRERELSPEDPATTLAIHNLASVLRDSGHLEEARPLFERSLSIRERLSDPMDPAIAISLTGLASLLELEGKVREAQPMCERALAINEKAFGPDHPDTASSAQDLARILQRQGKFAEAQPLYERALAANEKSLGSDHPKTNNTRYYFASLLVVTGRPAKALPLAQAALGALEKALGSKAGWTWTREAAIVTSAALNALGRTDEAKSVRQRFGLGDADVSSREAKSVVNDKPQGEAREHSE